MNNVKIEEMVKGISADEFVLDEQRILLAFNNDYYAESLDEETYSRFAAYLSMEDTFELPGSCCITFMASVNSACDLLNVPHVFKAKLTETVNEDGTVTKEVNIDKDSVFFPKFTIVDDKEKVCDPADLEHPSEDNEEVIEAPQAENVANSEPAIRFDYDKMLINTGEEEISQSPSKNTIDQEIMDDIDLYISNCVPDSMGYNYNILDCGLIDLVLFDKKSNNYLGTFQLDPNVFHGNGNYIMGMTPMGPAMVPLTEFKIVRKILSGDPVRGNYLLTPEEINTCSSYLFDDLNIYQYVDMSGNDFTKLSKEDYKQFGRNIERVLISYQNNLGGNVPRFRISSFTDINNFELVSDNKCKVVTPSQVPYTNGTSIVYNEGKALVRFSNGAVYGMLI